MDETNLRMTAMNLANQRAKQDASIQDIMRDAEAILGWMKGGGLQVPNTPDQHESVNAVRGQEPRRA